MPALDRIVERVALGAPGVYTLAPEPVRALTGVRLDACAFVGVAPRGPCRVPKVERSFSEDWRLCDPAFPRQRSVAVRVESFDAYRRLYGGYEGPGLLPYAVASFFEQGGREAWVVRIVHEHGSALVNAQAASALLGGVAEAALLHARNEGSWGNGLRASLSLRTRALVVQPLDTSTLQLAAGQRLPAGTLLRLRLVDGSHVLRFVASLATQGHAQQPRQLLRATLESATPLAVAAAELLEAEFEARDAAGATERFVNLGLHVDHPRWLASVLCRESSLLWPDIAWAGSRLTPNDPLLLRGGETAPFSGGEDRYAALTHDDFFDPAWDPREDEPAAGLQAVASAPGITQIVLPDLYQPAPLPPQSDVRDPSFAGPDFALCVALPAGPATAANEAALPGLMLDPSSPADLAHIVTLFQQVQAFVETTRDHIALLDVPPGLKPAQVAAFRSHFDSSYCALYHPWLAVPTADDGRDALVNVPPAAAAAGIVAARELAFGIPHGPANQVVRQALRPLVRLAGHEHDFLHPLGVNVFLQEPQGVRLTAARTLSLNPSWRQLSVRRLVLMLRRTLLQQMQWVAFEPHTPALRRQVAQVLSTFLRRLFVLGAFTGASEEEAFFVQCDADLNPPGRVDNGELLAHVGVAPAEPIEFIVLQFSRSGDGTLALETA